MSELLEALIAAGVPEEKARAVDKAFVDLLRAERRLPAPLPGDLKEEEVRIIVLDAETCFVQGKRTVSVDAAIKIMQMLRESEKAVPRS